MNLENILRNRPNKTAKGMTKTAHRSGHNLSSTALTLSVRGTTDVLGRWRSDFKRTVVTRYSLGDRGKAKLVRLLAQRSPKAKSK